MSKAKAPKSFEFETFEPPSDPPKAGASKRHALYVRLLPEAKVRLAAKAKEKGVTPNTLAKRVLTAFAQDDAARVALPPSVKAYASPKRQRLIRFTDAEDALIEALAARAAMRPAPFLVRLLRTALLKTPQPTTHELAVLDESQRQVRAVGVNLNQIARALNERPHDSLPTGLVENIDGLADVIRRHTASVDKVLKASVERWT